jgi:hypothetical protein
MEPVPARPASETPGRTLEDLLTQMARLNEQMEELKLTVEKHLASLEPNKP